MNANLTYSELAEKLKEANLHFDGKDLWCADQKLSYNAAKASVERFGVTMHDVGKLYRQQNRGSSWEDNKRIVPVISPLFSRNYQWNELDKKLFSCFKYAINPTDGSQLLLVHAPNNRMYPMPSGGTVRLELARLSALCASIKVSETQSLKDCIDDAFQEACAEATRKAAGLADSDKFAEWCVGHLPTTMVTHETLNLVVAVEQNEACKVSNPIGAFFGRPSDYVDPLRFVVEHPDVIASNPTNMVPMPVIYSNDPKVPALNYLNLDAIVSDTPCPTWEFWLKRFTEDEAKVFMAYVWSIFDAGNTSRQLLYIYDKDGFSGKSVVLNAIFNGLGEDLCVALQKDSLSNQFAMAKIYGKRLITIDDNKNPNLIRSEKMHMILGGAVAEIEQKGRNSFSAKLCCRVIACGNVMLTIDTQALHESSRVIVIKPKLTDEILQQIAAKDADGDVLRDASGRPKLIGDSSFGDRLKDEFSGFLFKCRSVYKELCPTRASIIVPDSILEHNDEMGDEHEDVYDSLMEYFDVGAEFRCTPTELIESVTCRLRNSIGERLGCTYNGFLTYLMKRYPITKKTVRIGKNTPKMFVGIGIKSSQPQLYNMDDSFQLIGGNTGT